MATKVAHSRKANIPAQPQDGNWTSNGPNLIPSMKNIASTVDNGSENSNSAKVPVVIKRKKQAKSESLIGSLCTLICDHQIGLSVNLILLLFLAHISFPRARRRTSKFIHLQYYNPENGLYGGGNDDIYFVATWIVIFTFLRAFVMDYILQPSARLCGIKSKKDRIRFCEQAWLIIYDSQFWTLGMYLMYNSVYWFDLKGMWKTWPNREITGLFKWYYLVQFAFWVQQILVVNIEEKRKDYAQMFTHHIVTCALMVASYGFYQTPVGNVILCIMDVVDIILPAAKLLKYVGFTNACDYAFGLFILVWTVTRHVFYMMVCWSIYAHTPSAMAQGCHLSDGSFIPVSSSTPFDKKNENTVWKNVFARYLDRDGPVCWNPVIRWSFLGLLLSLQVILILWFSMIVRVAYKVISGGSADDVRSDDEGDESEDIEVDDIINPQVAVSINNATTGPEWTPLEQEVSAEALAFARRSSPGVRSYRKSGRGSRGSSSRTSGISISGHSDRKELLGRIGCDKPA